MFSYQSASLASANDEKLYALVDCAIDDRIYQRIRVGLNAANHANLFRGTFARDAEKYSPVLIDLDQVAIDRQAFMQKLLAACEGKPLLSFISARDSLDPVAYHLRQLLKIKTADDQAFLLRYADNRMLPAMYSVLTDTQQRAFLGPIGTWFVADHRTQVLALRAPQTGASETDTEAYPLQLDDRQFALLLERTEIHSMVAQLEQSYESFAQNFTLVERIQFVERNNKQASDYGFTGDADRLSWCGAALRGGESFFRHPQIMPLLDSTLQSRNNLFDALLRIPPADWPSMHGTDVA